MYSMKGPPTTPSAKLHALPVALEASLRAIAANGGEHVDAQRVSILENLIDELLGASDLDAGSVGEVLADLRNDLAYFVPNPAHGVQDPSYFGPAKASALALIALSKIERLLRDISPAPNA
ncbi:hypothetical protein [Phenylobacterium aquaticum]|uniref:hypothetical protein n=1 Tax=Phenylobacterium aquaticum TaxID=1763816 RepID=UPI001F5CB0AE|nr:hypothetical protein [Phenylobacterium aquaticum]MCI3135026.1 hypothetical protein [Phenylobacterium aquaticum]